MLEICSIASGSNGNCYYIGNEKDAILIDAGISKKQILIRMKQRNLNPAKLKAVLNIKGRNIKGQCNVELLNIAWLH